LLGSARAARSVVVLPTPTGFRKSTRDAKAKRSRRTHQRSARRRRPRRQKARHRPRPAPGQPVAIVICRLFSTDTFLGVDCDTSHVQDKEPYVEFRPSFLVQSTKFGMSSHATQMLKTKFNFVLQSAWGRFARVATQPLATRSFFND